MTQRRPPLPWPGGCQCGAVRYGVTAPPLTLYCCHCRECQRQSSSAFGMSMLVAPDALSIDWSGLASRARDEGLPTEVAGRFCGACGVRIVHGRPERDVVSLKAGTLDDTAWLRPVGHVWTDSAQPWVALDPALLSYARQPEDDDALFAAWRAQEGLAA